MTFYYRLIKGSEVQRSGIEKEIFDFFFKIMFQTGIKKIIALIT